MGCGCSSGPSVATGSSSCGCTAPTPQASVISQPVVRIDCCGATRPVLTPIANACGCSSAVPNLDTPQRCCFCTEVNVPRYPSGVSLVDLDSTKKVWSF